jgi:hypothetical protein
MDAFRRIHVSITLARQQGRLEVRITRRWLGTGLALAIVLCGTGERASADVFLVDINDAMDGNPIATGNLLGQVSAPSFESVTITGALDQANFITPGTRSVILTEPAADPFNQPNSDFLTLTASTVLAGQTTQGITIFFQSDSAPGFDQNIALLSTLGPVARVEENGMQQILSGLLNVDVNKFKITVTSDFASAEVPEINPGSMVSGIALLLGGTLMMTGRLRRLAATPLQ